MNFMEFRVIGILMMPRILEALRKNDSVIRR